VVTWLAIGCPFSRRLSRPGLVRTLASRLLERWNQAAGHSTDPAVRAVRRRDRRAASRVAASGPAGPAAGRGI